MWPIRYMRTSCARPMCSPSLEALPMWRRSAIESEVRSSMCGALMMTRHYTRRLWSTIARQGCALFGHGCSSGRGVSSSCCRNRSTRRWMWRSSRLTSSSPSAQKSGTCDSPQKYLSVCWCRTRRARSCLLCMCPTALATVCRALLRLPMSLPTPEGTFGWCGYLTSTATRASTTCLTTTKLRRGMNTMRRSTRGTQTSRSWT
mmetsp:Transcript_46073/g.75177  ORF Transcript_46073/g.75177 Transcript_46073/m.75177 type:complete len:203 (-) Transcript_46073:1057-1665(-)